MVTKGHLPSVLRGSSLPRYSKDSVNRDLSRISWLLPTVARNFCKCEARMAAPGIAPLSVALEGTHQPGAVPTQALLAAMLRASEKVSDLIFSPGRPPQVEVFGQLVPVQVEGLSHPLGRRYASHCRRSDRQQQASDQHAPGTRFLRHFLWPSGPGALPGERFHSAGKLRCRYARDSNRDPRV